MKEHESTDPGSTGRPRLCGIVLTRNEARVIERCLGSLRFCDELIVVDSGSTDATREIAVACGARVHEHPDWPGFAEQRNRGLGHARATWCLMVDADEWVPEPLAHEILAAIEAGNASAFRMPRLSSYCGQFIRHGGWWPDHVTRLMRRDAARYEGRIHERCVVDGPVGTLTEPLMHESFRDLEQVLGKMNAYSTWGAQSLHEKGRRPGLTSAVAHGLWTFIRTWLLRGGFLDGRRGFMLAVSNAEGAYYKYVKAMLLAEPADALDPRLRMQPVETTRPDTPSAIRTPDR
jgi:hypothetical protein